MSPSFLGLKNKARKNQREEGSKKNLLHGGLLLGLFFNPDYEAICSPLTSVNSS
jgi:hypothetical protein